MRRKYARKTGAMAAAGFLFLCLIAAGCASPGNFDENTWRKKVNSTKASDLFAPHFRDGLFFNPWMPREEKGFMELLQWKLSRKESYTEAEKNFKPAFVPGAPGRIKTIPDGDIIMWVGHATFLMRLGGDLWLTDPMFSDRALLPKRKMPPAITAGDLKDIGVKKINVIISHNHYDHLDRETIASLPDNTRFFVPLGLKKFMTDLGKNDVIEMDWWQTADAGGGIEIACLPAQHWSRRIGQETNATLWASFMITTPEVKIYFAGDSGYFTGYREIGARHPGIDYVLMPTTAFQPRWFMHYSHMDIDEAIDAFHDLNARYFIPTQWGTFQLGNEPPGYPILELKRKIVEKNLDPSRFLIMDIGQIIPLRGKTRQAG